MRVCPGSARGVAVVVVAYSFVVTVLVATVLHALDQQRYTTGELLVAVVLAASALGVIARGRGPRGAAAPNRASGFGRSPG